MSTKIYEAWKVNDLSMDELMQFFHTIRNDYFKSCVEFVRKVKGDDDFGTVADELRTSMNSSERGCYNFGASIMVYFNKGEMYIQFFGMDFTDSPALKELVDNHLTDYHYQNQSDAYYDFEFDEGKITEAERDEKEVEYEQRKIVWDEIYGNRWRPNECGLVFELCTKDDYYKIAGKVFNLEGFGD